MWEWTPPYETRPRRWTSPPRSRARRNAETSASFRDERAVGDGVVHPHEILEEDSSGADREVADLGVAHLPGRKADSLSRRGERRVRVAGPQRVEHRCVRELDRVARPGRSDPPTIEDDERDELQAVLGGRAADRLERREVERGPADESAVHVGQREQHTGVLGLDRAAVEHGRRVQRLHERMRLLRDLGGRRAPGSDRPDRLVRDDEPLVARDDTRPAARARLRSPRPRARPRSHRRTR